MPFRHLLDGLLDLLERSGLRTEIRPNMHDFMQAMLGATGKRLGNPELDPRLHDFSPATAFWVRIADRSDRTIAFMASRRLDVASPGEFRELVDSYRIWFGERIIVNERVECVLADDVPVPSGTIAFGAGMWVRPDARGRGLSWIISRIQRLVSFEQWRHDWDAGFAFGGIARIGLPVYSYGLGRIDLYGRSILMPGYTPLDLYLVTQPHADFARQCADELARLRDWGPIAANEDFGERVRAMKPHPASEYFDGGPPKTASEG